MQATSNFMEKKKRKQEELELDTRGKIWKNSQLLHFHTMGQPPHVSHDIWSNNRGRKAQDM